jgi:hypothetical protein
VLAAGGGYSGQLRQQSCTTASQHSRASVVRCGSRPGAKGIPAGRTLVAARCASVKYAGTAGSTDPQTRQEGRPSAANRRAPSTPGWQPQRLPGHFLRRGKQQGMQNSIPRMPEQNARHAKTPPSASHP